MKRVVIIGGGWSGIYALKHCLEEGFAATLLEAKDNLFGVWHYSRLPGGVLRSTHATSSTVFMQPSDFPFPKNTPFFPHHDVIEQHLKNYCDYFSLCPHIKTNHKVITLKKEGDGWVINTNKGLFHSDYVIVATGLNAVPKTPSEKIYERFSGRAEHTHYFSEKTKNELKNKTVLIIGGGETACDIANILSQDSRVHVSIREGQWFQGRAFGAYEPADVFYNRLVHSNVLTRSWAITIFRKQMEFWWGVGGSGVHIWKPTTNYFNGFYNKSRDVIEQIAKGDIIPQKKALDIKGNNILFEGSNEWIHFDAILFGTGYNYKKGLSFLEEEYLVAPKYKHIFPVNDPTIAFVGYVRPYLGSIPMLSEIQSRLVAQVFSHKKILPKQKKMLSIIKKDVLSQKKEFPKDSKRMPFLVNPFSYSDEIAKEIGQKPHMYSLLFTNPSLWLKLLLQPWSPFQYRIYDSAHKKESALRQIDELSKSVIGVKLKKKILLEGAKSFLFITWVLLFLFFLYQLLS